MAHKHPAPALPEGADDVQLESLPGPAENYTAAGRLRGSVYDAEMERLSIEVNEFAAAETGADVAHTVTEASVTAFVEMLASHRAQPGGRGLLELED